MPDRPAVPRSGAHGRRAGLPAGYKENPARFKGGDGWKVAQPSDAMLRGQWWKIFKDPELNGLEDSLEINNQNIKEYFQNFMEARALVGEANAQLYPTLTANASYLRSLRPAPAAPAPAPWPEPPGPWQPRARSPRS